MFVDMVVGWLRRRGWVCIPPERVGEVFPMLKADELDTLHGPWPPPGAYC